MDPPFSISLFASFTRLFASSHAIFSSNISLFFLIENILDAVFLRKKSAIFEERMCYYKTFLKFGRFLRKKMGVELAKRRVQKEYSVLVVLVDH